MQRSEQTIDSIDLNEKHVTQVSNELITTFFLLIFLAAASEAAPIMVMSILAGCLCLAL